MPFLRRGFRPRGLAVRRVAIAALIVTRKNANTVQVTQNNITQECTVVHFSDGSEGFCTDGVFYDMGKNIRQASEVV